MSASVTSWPAGRRTRMGGTSACRRRIECTQALSPAANPRRRSGDHRGAMARPRSGTRWRANRTLRAIASARVSARGVASTKQIAVPPIKSCCASTPALAPSSRKPAHAPPGPSALIPPAASDKRPGGREQEEPLLLPPNACHDIYRQIRRDADTGGRVGLTHVPPAFLRALALVLGWPPVTARTPAGTPGRADRPHSRSGRDQVQSRPWARRAVSRHFPSLTPKIVNQRTLTRAPRTPSATT
jgi:hypothetical protein